ncbi:MAG: FKBP-type peptidyl-prolyl cis-trans isomerase [Aequorivita sp.]
MMMKIKYGFALLIVMLAVTVSCKKDDDGPDPPVPPRDRGEEAISAQAEIESFLETHFYNYEDFEADPNNFKIKFDTIEGDNALKTPLMEQVTFKEVNDINDTDVTYKLYYLKVREGGGDRPHFSDYTTNTYEGRKMNLELFDSSVIPIRFNLVDGRTASGSPIPGIIRGLQQALIEFKGAEGDPIVNPDGTLSFENFGIGAVFIPSGLGYYQYPPSGNLSVYEQLIFSFQLFAREIADHDGDGIPSYMEDLNGNQYLMDDDTDSDGLPNYLDDDDDGDGRLTKFEIEIVDGEIIFPDTNGNGIPDYLDDTI